MKTYKVNGIVNVNMYGTLLDPSVSLDNAPEDIPESQIEELWNRFEHRAYVSKVCELAVVELKKLLSRLPPSLCCSYIDESASIISPKEYNYGGDTLWFQLNADTDMSEKAFQTYLNGFFLADWEDEFGPDYNIFAQLRENYSLHDFLQETANDAFEYGGYHFIPVRRFRINEGDFFEIMQRCGSYSLDGMSTYKWKDGKYSYQSFYEASGNSNCDIFYCEESGLLYVPGENELFCYTSNQTLRRVKKIVKDRSISNF